LFWSRFGSEAQASGAGTAFLLRCARRGRICRVRLPRRGAAGQGCGGRQRAGRFGSAFYNRWLLHNFYSCGTLLVNKKSVIFFVAWGRKGAWHWNFGSN
jgi:hypothetical protein